MWVSFIVFSCKKKNSKCLFHDCSETCRFWFPCYSCKKSIPFLQQAVNRPDIRLTEKLQACGPLVQGSMDGHHRICAPSWSPSQSHFLLRQNALLGPKTSVWILVFLCTLYLIVHVFIQLVNICRQVTKEQKGKWVTSEAGNQDNTS